ncbi:MULTISPECIES: hypothetical protein [unclassified Moorena]|uniref:hypothetical protein n=1 Tax=unclassified Moorena TaxID=2683338 RepID=UPI0013BA8FC5|nr:MULTISPECIES: hypothetical protein [unclassified Moorena]NEQ09149.1 hypothetical protein [Moorena sp. SIO4E2]NES42602.1 hypothetical protein [Moorena sp. SIO2C4]
MRFDSTRYPRSRYRFTGSISRSLILILSNQLSAISYQLMRYGESPSVEACATLLDRCF